MHLSCRCYLNAFLRKIVFILSVADNLVSQGYNAGKMLKESAKIAGGGGGGKPNLAQAGAKDRSKI